ncbi:hypothetical protein V1477_016035 [Vespula maculifrons]|uniref:Uncharacterized protein n=1 Tax=Vespula maculifrons TaxID=7453 RepID=A0ABD2BBV1_VESMC
MSYTKGETNTSQKNSREIAKAGMTRNERDARRTYVTNKYSFRFILINSSFDIKTVRLKLVVLRQIRF